MSEIMEGELRTEIEVAGPGAALPATTMLERALASGADTEVLSRLMDLQDRHEKAAARRAFDAAIAAAKSVIKPVTKNRTGNNSKGYADFAAYAAAIDPALSQNGLSYRFRTSQNDRITVTCIIAHVAGHFEETSLSGPADKTGSKNDIQAIGSTLTYLQRYTLVAALGLAASEDDDGRAVGSDGVLSEDQLQKLREAMDEAGAPVPAFCRAFKIEALKDLPATSFALALERVAEFKREKAAKGAAK